MVTGKGTPIEVRRCDQIIEHLPNLPTLAQLAPDTFEAIEVPPDDLDACVDQLLGMLGALRQRFPGHRLIADYTGGTKTMSAALVTAALEISGVELQIIAGARADLVKVHDGSQVGLAIEAEMIRLRRAMTPYLAAWRRFAYGECAEGLGALALPRDPGLRGELQIAKGLSLAFDAWDRFDHTAALTGLEKWPSGQLVKPRSENAMSTSLHLLSLRERTWRGILAPRVHLECFKVP